MAYENIDRRKHRRAFFSIEDNIQGVFILYGEKEIAFKAPILDLCRGGLHFTLKKSQRIFPVSGDRLRLVKIEGEAALDDEVNIYVGIKWILEHESCPHISCGGEFLHVPKAALDRISEFVDSKYAPKTV